jgi:hypothetical protein
MPSIMKPLLALLLALALSPALAQHHGRGYGGYGPGGARPMPPPERRMAWEERQRMRDQVRGGQMSREEARQRWYEQRGRDPARFSPEQREQLRRDIQETNRDLERRR